MATLFLATVIFVGLCAVMGGDRKVVVSEWTEDGWVEPIDVDEAQPLALQPLAMQPLEVAAEPQDRYADFDPSEWVFDCGRVVMVDKVVPFARKSKVATMSRQELLQVAEQRAIVGYKKMSTERLRRVLAA